MKKRMKTKRGTTMVPKIVARLQHTMLLPEYEHATHKEIAAAAQVALVTVRRYLTPEFLADIAQKRQNGVTTQDMQQLDKTLLHRAMSGDMAAAKVIYARWDRQQADVKAFAELDDEALLAELQKQNVGS